jgi:hypothetical protein
VPDLGGVIRLRRKVVAEERRLRGKPVTGELHTVTGIAGEADDYLFQLLPRRTGAAVLTHDFLPFTPRPVVQGPRGGTSKTFWCHCE